MREVSAEAHRRLGLAVEVEALARFVARLSKLGAIEDGRAPAVGPVAPADAPQRSLTSTTRLGPARIEVHPDARFLCEGFGTCCESGYVIPLSTTAAQALRQASLRILGPEAADPVTVLPTEPGQPWRLALDNERGCPFLDAERRCAIHGEALQPDPCRVFPFAFMRHGDRVYATVTHRCLCGQDGRGLPLQSAELQLERRLAASRVVPVLPGTTQVDDGHALPTRVAVRLVQASTFGPRGPFEALLQAGEALLQAAQIPPTRRATFAPNVLQARLAAGLEVWEDEAVWAALRQEPHPQARRIRARQRQVAFTPRSTPEAEAARFVRDHLFGLRLWEASTLARGLLTLGVAVHGILDQLPRRSPFFTARLRVMLQEDALTSSRLRGLYGAGGPLGVRTGDLSWVVRQLRRMAR